MFSNVKKMSHPNPFQPWKPHAPGLMNLSSGNYMHFHLSNSAVQPPSQAAGVPIPPNSQSFAQNLAANHQPSPANEASGLTKGPNHFQKLNSLDKFAGLENLVNSDLGADERQVKLQQFAEKNIRLFFVPSRRLLEKYRE